MNLTSTCVRRHPRVRPAPAGMVLLAALLSACGAQSSSTPSAQASGVSATAGSMVLSQARIPQPAAPDVAVAYFNLTNEGDAPDQLISASSSAALMVMPMKDVTHANASTMVDVKSLAVPAHGRIELRPGGMHLMLERLTRTLRVGDQVVLRLTFTHAGTLTVTVPVTPLSAGAAEPSDMSSMPGM